MDAERTGRAAQRDTAQYIKPGDIRAGDELYTSVIGAWKYHRVLKVDRGDLSVDVTVEHCGGGAVQHLSPETPVWVRQTSKSAARERGYACVAESWPGTHMGAYADENCD